MSETYEACTRGCTMLRRHLGDCEDTEACKGCLPRRAEHGHLCWPCHRRLELMLHDAETVDRWLTGNIATGQGAAAEDIKITGSKEIPLPIKVEVHVVRQELRDHWATWVDWLCERHGITPTRSEVDSDARRLISWLDRIECWDEIDDLWEQTAWLYTRAHDVAPWRPGVRRLGTIPCPDCGEVNLLIYGGETDVTCGSCSMMIPEERFPLWERIVREHYGIGVTA